MEIRLLALRDFRRFAGFEARFGPGLNVVLGHNEAGKSTLREAIALALFQDPKTNDRKVLANQRWGAAERFALKMEFGADGEVYRLEKDFQARTASLENLTTGERLQDARAIEARVREILGLPSRAAFESTVRVTQRDITNIRGGKEIADRLQELVTGGEQDVQASRVLAELDKALAALRSASRVTPGPLHVLPPRLAEVRASLAEREQALARAQVARGELVASQARLEEARQELERLEALERDCARRLRLTDELDEREREEAELEGRLEQLREAKEAIAREEARLAEDEAVLALPAAEAAEVALLAREASEPPPVVTLAPAPSSAPARRPNWAWLAGGVVLALAGLVGGTYHPALWGLVVVGLGLVALSFLRVGRGEGEAAVIAARLRAQEERQRAEEARQRLAALLARAGCASAEEFQRRRQEALARERRLGELRARVEGLLAGEDEVALEASRRAASKRVRDLKEELNEPAMRLAAMDLAAYQRLVRDIARLAEEVRLLEGQVEDLRVEARARQVAADDVHALAEEEAELQAALEAALRRQRVLVLTRQVLAEAREATMVTAREVLERDLGALVSAITGGRYEKVAVDPADLSLSLLSPEREAPLAVSLDAELSTGTVEQVYLAARLAIARLLAQGRRPPLLLDDPFVTFDAPRTAAVLALCRRLSTEHQVILFTCHEPHATAADHVIRLPAV